MGESTVRGCLRKLALWQTRTFRPILTHDELDPIMSTLGFIGLPPSPASAASSSTLLWKEYAYCAQWSNRRLHSAPPRPPPRLPYPRIDGLHSCTYHAFIDAVNFFVEMPDISILFHVRGLPLQRAETRKKWRSMTGDVSVFVYREGTIDQSTLHLYRQADANKSHQGVDDTSSDSSGKLIRDTRGGSSGAAPLPEHRFVALKDIIVFS